MQEPKVKCAKKCCPKGQKCLAGACAVPCSFVTAGSVMTLQANCATASSIAIPDGVTLDGDGKTISLAGSLSGFGTAGVTNESCAATVNVRNLTINGAGLSGTCANGSVEGIGFSQIAGEIEDVSVLDLPCGSGISLTALDTGSRKAVDLANVTIRNTTPAGAGGSEGTILLVGAINASITDSTVRDVGGENFGVRAIFGATADISGTTFENMFAAVVAEGTEITADDNTITNVRFGLSALFGANLVVTNNTIVGAGAAASISVGVSYGAGDTGEVSGNTITNFLDTLAGETSCGIFVDADAGAVTIGANTFPDPPGNGQNVCDFRP